MAKPLLCVDRKGIVLARAPEASLSVMPAALRVANRPIVWHVLEALQSAGVTETFVVGESKALQAVRAAVDGEGSFPGELTYLPTKGQPDLAAMLAPAAPFVGDASCIVHASDGLVGQPLAPLIERLRPDRPDLVLLLHGNAPQREADSEALQLLHLSEITGFRSPTSLAGACLLGIRALSLACEAPDDPEGHTGLTALAERVAAGGGRVHAGRVRWRSYSGDPSDLLEMNRMVLDQLPVDLDVVETDGNRIEGRVLVHPTAEIRNSVIVGPAIIGSHACIENSYIGPYTSIASHVRVDGAEISRSIVLERARILHLRERIECSTIGPGACLRSDFELPRSMRFHVGADAELIFN